MAFACTALPLRAQRLPPFSDSAVSTRVRDATRPARPRTSFEVACALNGAGPSSAGEERQFNVSRRAAFLAALSVALASPSAALATITKGEKTFTVSEKVPGPPAIQYTFSFPLTWKKRFVNPPRPGGVYCFWDQKEKDVVALGVTDTDAKSLADLGKPEDFVNSIAKTLLEAPIDESDEDPDIRIFSAAVQEIGGREYLVAELQYDTTGYTDTGRRYQRQRKATTKIAVSGGKIYALTCSALIAHYKAAGINFRSILDSFAVTDA